MAPDRPVAMFPVPRGAQRPDQSRAFNAGPCSTAQSSVPDHIRVEANTVTADAAWRNALGEEARRHGDSPPLNVRRVILSKSVVLGSLLHEGPLGRAHRRLGVRAPRTSVSPPEDRCDPLEQPEPKLSRQWTVGRR